MPPLLNVINVRKAFDGKPVLTGLSLSLNEGEVICVLGESGCGKTTLLRCLNLLEYIDTGAIEHRGSPVIVAGPEELNPDKVPYSRSKNGALLFVDENVHRQHLGMVFQSFNLFPNLTVLGNVIEGPVHVKGRSRPDAIDRARSLLARMGMEGKEQAYPHQLSGGQQQRVAIARALAMDPDILLLDEITSALDPLRVAELLKLILQLRKTESKAMVIVTHHLEFAKEVADQICFMSEGKVLEKGRPAAVLENPTSPQLRNFLENIAATR